ncbi:MAG: outer membrane protein assembly factor BamE (lipoprotein component of BamABCDE complex) [Alphaproteobacteria bacterium]|jgi:outer membrane protein assembly factor BamE (lipoprotein component of BamABCDE complex)
MLKQTILTITVLCTVVFATSACTKRMETHGSIVKQERLDRIQIGSHTKNDVAELLGSPSATGTFNDKRWYYFTEKAAVGSLGRSKLLEREIVIVDFDKQGVVSSLTFKSKDDAQKVNPSKKTTTTHGQTLGIIDQFINNLGKGF